MLNQIMITQATTIMHLSLQTFKTIRDLGRVLQIALTESLDLQVLFYYTMVGPYFAEMHTLIFAKAMIISQEWEMQRSD
jgi:hypothetical protein